MRETEVDKVMACVCDAEQCDLCFLLDATSSMSSHIVAVKRQVLVRRGARTSQVSRWYCTPVWKTAGLGLGSG